MNDRRRMTGVVTSNKMTKTVVVEITRVFRHPLYRKVVHSSKRVKAHDEIGCQIGARQPDEIAGCIVGRQQSLDALAQRRVARAGLVQVGRARHGVGLS